MLFVIERGGPLNLVKGHVELAVGALSSSAVRYSLPLCRRVSLQTTALDWKSLPRFWGLFCFYFAQKLWAFCSTKFLAILKRRSCLMSATATTPRVDIQTRITNQSIVEQLAAGGPSVVQAVERRISGGSDFPPLATQRSKVFRGQRPDSLAVGGTSGVCLSLLADLSAGEGTGGACLRKGSMVPQWSTLPPSKRRRRQTTDRKSKRKFRSTRNTLCLMRNNVKDCPLIFTALAEPPQTKLQRIEHADRFFANTGAKIESGGNRAYYALEPDRIGSLTSRRSGTRNHLPLPSPMNVVTGPDTPAA